MMKVLAPPPPDIRATLRDWALWRAGEAELTPETERIEAVYESGLLAPEQQEAIRVHYLVPGITKRKYHGISHALYYARLRLSEAAVEHLAAYLASDSAVSDSAGEEAPA